MTGRLYRPRRGRVIGGVCAGLAQRFGIGKTTMRLIAVASCVLPGPQIVMYVVLWVLMPSEERVVAAP